MNAKVPLADYQIQYTLFISSTEQKAIQKSNEHSYPPSSLIDPDKAVNNSSVKTLIKRPAFIATMLLS